jgi:hypothetical protein
MLAKALEEDPNVFDYDAAVDEDARAAERQSGLGGAASGAAGAAAAAAARAAAARQQPRYISSILEQAQNRKKEQELIMERKLVGSCGAPAGAVLWTELSHLPAPSRAGLPLLLDSRGLQQAEASRLSSLVAQRCSSGPACLGAAGPRSSWSTPALHHMPLEKDRLPGASSRLSLLHPLALLTAPPGPLSTLSAS